MDDGIELNFAAPSGGAGVIRRKAAPPPPKKGSWVQRLKATKAVKRRAERQTTNGSGIQVAKETESARPNQQQQPKQAAQAPRPAQTSQAPSSRPLHADVDFVRIPNGAGAGQSKGKARASAPVEAPIDVASLAKRSARPPAPFAQQEGAPPHSNVASSSRSVPNAAGVGGHQIISSLFSSIPNASLQATDANAEDPDTVVSGAPSNAPSDDSTFIGLGLDPLIAHHLDAKLGIKRPTRIQRSVLRGMLDPTPLSLSPPVDPGDFHVADHLTGNAETRHRDAFIQSQTGSGKTLSYLLPIVQSLLPLASRKGYYVDRSIGTLAIILAPTRELARQISDVLDGLLSLSLSLPQPQTDDEAARHRAVYKRYLVSAVLTGGATRNHEKTRLRRGCPVLVCTPGRLLDHLQNTQSFRCDKLMWLVLDEADRLIEEGFGETLAGIMKALEGRRKIGHEADLALARVGDRPRSHAKPKHVTKFEDDALPDFLKDDSDDDEEEDDGWDYETMGPKPKRANNGVKVEDGDVKPIVAPEHANTTAWPYWSLGRRNVLCSATISGEVQKLAHVALKHPVMYRGSDAAKEDDGADDDEEPELKPIAVVKPSSTAATPAVMENFDLSGVPEEKFTPPSQLDQRYIVVPLKLRLVTLVALMRALIAKANANPDGQGTKIIVFMSCTDSVDYHWKLFGGVQMGATGAPVDSDEAEPVSRSCPLLPSTQIMRLHGSLPLQTRRTSLAAFSSSSTAETHKNSILFCTSVASRGLDMPLVRAVVQYDLPTEQGINEYVHRVGRTARVGRGGESWAFVSDKEADWVPWVEAGMSSHEAKSTSSSSSSAAANAPGQVKLRQVGVEDVLKRGFGVKSSPGVPAAVAASEYERRATQVQLAFERWVLDDGEVSCAHTFPLIFRDVALIAAISFPHLLRSTLNSLDVPFPPGSAPTRPIRWKKNVSSTSKTCTSVIWPRVSG